MSKHADTIYRTDVKFKQILMKDKWKICAIDIGRKNFAVCINNQDDKTEFVDKHEFRFSNPTELTAQITDYLKSIPILDADVVVVESQFKEATKNQKSQETVETFCNIVGIPYMRRSARNKTSSSYILDKIGMIRPDYKINIPKTLKRRSIYFCKIYHEKHSNPVFQELFNKLKKKDDICDVLLMCLYENSVIKERKRIDSKKRKREDVN